MPAISAIVITKNAGGDIVGCLKSVAFCGERIVVDCGSTDDTVKLAASCGARVVHNAWKGFGPQKNFALALATAPWVLSIDADEQVPPELAEEIIAAVQAESVDGFEIPRLTHFCGRPLYRSGTYPDFLLRLFRRGRAHFTDDLLHEKVVCAGEVRRLKSHLMHYSLPTLQAAVQRADQFSTLGAAVMVRSGKRTWFLTGIVRGLAAFLRIYVLRRGFMDGREGFLHAIYKSQTTFYRCMKAWEATRRRPRARQTPGEASDLRKPQSNESRDKTPA